MPEVVSDLWTLIWGRPQVDPCQLARAVERQIETGDLDCRTELLIRDSVVALERHWGTEKFLGWLAASPSGASIERIWKSNLGKPGFPTLRDRIMQHVAPNVVLDFLRDLSGRVTKPATMFIGGSIALNL